MKAKFRLNDTERVIKKNTLYLILDFELVEMNSWNFSELENHLKKVSFFKLLKNKITLTEKADLQKSTKKSERTINTKFKNGSFHVEITVIPERGDEDIEVDYWEIDTENDQQKGNSQNENKQ